MSTVGAGRAGESRGVRVLRAAGLVILERNYRCPLGEIDVVARDGETLVFVEIRTRTRADRGTALETVRADKQRRIARVAQHYLVARKPKMNGVRFDVVGITAEDVVHVRNAFRVVR